jgi:hypothetical protein
VPVDWPDGVRHGGGASLVCGFCMERGKASADTSTLTGVVTGRALRSGNCAALSTVAALAGGPARSSGEASVMGVERRGRLIRGLFARATGRGISLGRRRVGKSGPMDKPFVIPKQLVWEAYKQVKRNKGAAGVDGVSIEEFEADLKNNLYRIWTGCPREHIFHLR